jgi:NhaA family Na+:H+ antiporter
MNRRSKLFKQFFKSEKSGGLTLVFFTLISLFLANSAWGNLYIHFWEMKLGALSLEHWINDGLMAIFFLLIGLELKHEFQSGELASVKKASLPIFSALGGMIVPAAIFIAFNFNEPTSNGFGIPMATDIAFALAAISMLGNRVPLGLKVFLTALAVIDDLGAILVIATCYTSHISWVYLVISLLLFLLLIYLNRKKVNTLVVYLVVGFGMWFFMLQSGVHATIAGVLLAFTIPTYSKLNQPSLAVQLQKKLHYPVPFLILPLFALANTAVQFQSGWENELYTTASYGILFGLVCGKPIGIFLFSWIAIRLKFAQKPSQTTWMQLVGASILGGIGFTMSIFVTLLAFTDPIVVNGAKITILISSLFAASLGIFWLRFLGRLKK